MNTLPTISNGSIRTSRMAIWTTAILAVATVLPRESKAQATTGWKQVEGRVESLTTAPMGELDGANLADGTVIHWPPHLGDRFAGVAAVGDRVRVMGRMETGPEGDTHLEVQTLTNLGTKASVENDAGPPPPPRGPGRKVGPPPRRRPDFAPPEATNDQLERRLKALEDQIAQLREEIQALRNEL